MPIKCLFLDVEGTLTTTDSFDEIPRSCRDMTPKFAANLLILKHVVYLTRCKLIVTGAIRRDPQLVQDLNKIFKGWGIPPFYSITVPMSVGKILPEKRRAKEVLQWLKNRNVKTWCVVDTLDLSALDDEKVERTVMVDGRIGLSRADHKSILDILKVEPDLYR